MRYRPAASAVVTRPRDLRTGRSIWANRRASPVAHRPLANDIETDVLVIGAGITGAMVAQALAVSGLRVVIADKRGPAKGSTTASTALVQYEIDTPLVTLTRKIGRVTRCVPGGGRAWRSMRWLQRSASSAYPTSSGATHSISPAISSTRTVSSGRVMRAAPRAWR